MGVMCRGQLGLGSQQNTLFFRTVTLNLKNSELCSHSLNICDLLQLIENKIFSKLPCEAQKNGYKRKPLRVTIIMVIVSLIIVNIYIYRAPASTGHWGTCFSIIVK